LVELVLLELRGSSLKLDMAQLLVVGANLLRGVWGVVGVRGDLSDTSILLEVLRIL
jgi:hypothetical protein